MLRSVVQCISYLNRPEFVIIIIVTTVQRCMRMRRMFSEVWGGVGEEMESEKKNNYNYKKKKKNKS